MLYAEELGDLLLLDMLVGSELQAEHSQAPEGVGCSIGEAPGEVAMMPRVICTVQQPGPILDMALASSSGEHADQVYAATCKVTGGQHQQLSTSTVGSCSPSEQPDGVVYGDVQTLHNSTLVTSLMKCPPGLYPAATGLWAVPSSFSDPHHSLLVFSYLEASRALALSLPLQDVTDVLGVSACEATLECALVQEQLMVQVSCSCQSPIKLGVALYCAHITCEQQECWLHARCC